MAKQWGPVAMANEIQMMRSLFRYGHEAELLEKPIRFGPGFKKPSAKTHTASQVRSGPRMFTPEQIKALLEVATPNMRAMILMAINGGLGNTDLGTLPTQGRRSRSRLAGLATPQDGRPATNPACGRRPSRRFKRCLTTRRKPKRC